MNTSQLKHFLSLAFFLIISFNVTAQNTGGIGAVLQLDTTQDGSTLARIKSLVPNGPAAAQQVPEGYYIISVNEVPCRNKTLEEIVNNIRGAAGTTVILSLANNPKGKPVKNYSLVRAAIQTQAPGLPAVDPVAIFNQECENEVKKLRKEGFAIIKTFNSDCGDYFFNFDSENSLFHAKALTMEAKPAGTYNQGFEASAVLFDNSDETVKTPLKLTGTRDQGNYVVTELDGAMTLKRNSIGVVNIQVKPLADAKKCMAMYVIVYR